MDPFKAYDIRGIYGETLDEDLAYRIGRALPTLLNAQNALIGRDARLSSPPLAAALALGLTDAGCNVDDMGEASTPMVYFATANAGYDLSIQITASHNPANWCGFKISQKNAVPVGYDTGLATLEKMVQTTLPPLALTKGKLKRVQYRTDFILFLRQFLQDIQNLNLVIDCSDGMGALTARELLGCRHTYIAATPDGTFPSHSPNPLEECARTPLVKAVRTLKADAGIIYDGDADRVMVVDENGNFIRPDIMTAIIARYYLRTNKNATILQDIRTSRGVTEDIIRNGGKTDMWKVGHAYAKRRLKEKGAICGGELAGHYYFRDFYSCDSGELASILIANEIARAKRQGITLSSLISPINCYANSGEINYKIEAKQEAMEAIKSHLLATKTPEKLLDFDGYRIEYNDWWVNIRPSNTEPYLRMIIEAQNQELLTEKRTLLENILGIRQ